MLRITCFLLTVLLTASCYWDDQSQWSPHFDGTAFVPVYISSEEASRISFEPGRSLVQPGKIYLLEPYLFINETGRGIHVIDNSDPKNPKNISFISIPGNHDMAAKDNWLYADNFSDLLTFDISDPTDVRLINRLEKTIPVHEFPLETGVYFECAESSKGIVVRWEKRDFAAKPKCWR